MSREDIIQLIVPIAPLRTEANDRAEMCTQVLCGELAVVLELGEQDWIRIRLVADGYEGWTDGKQWSNTLSPSDQFVLQRPLSSWEREDGAVVQLPAGGRVAKQGDTWVWNKGLMVPLHPMNELFEAPGGPLDAVIRFMGAPYLWGGKSALGIDCSGLIQVAFDLAGTSLPRDASQQVHAGELVTWEAREQGHVAFFHNQKGSIVHVGILSSRDSIIHAAGEVRLDDLNERGIWRGNRQTHQLHSIRFIPS